MYVCRHVHVQHERESESESCCASGSTNLKANVAFCMYVSDSDGRIGRAQAGNDVYSGRPGMPSLDSVLFGGPESRIGKCLPIMCRGMGAGPG